MEQGKVSSEALKNKLTYHPDSGLFTWNYSVGRAKEGQPAGCINKTTGYLPLGLMEKGIKLTGWLGFMFTARILNMR